MKKSLLVFYIVWLSLVVVMPLIMLIAMGAIVDDFIPSKKLFPYANYLNIFSLIVLIFTYVIVINETYSFELAFLNMTKKKLSACFLVAWILLSTLSYSALSGPVSYLLHKANDVRNGHVIEEVVKTTELYKRCDRHLSLVGDLIVYNRKVCNAPLADVKKLSRGGKIKIVGQINDYGISNFSYEKVNG